MIFLHDTTNSSIFECEDVVCTPVRAVEASLCEKRKKTTFLPPGLEWNLCRRQLRFVSWALPMFVSHELGSYSVCFETRLSVSEVHREARQLTCVTATPANRLLAHGEMCRSAKALVRHARSSRGSSLQQVGIPGEAGQPNECRSEYERPKSSTAVRG